MLRTVMSSFFFYRPENFICFRSKRQQLKWDLNKDFKVYIEVSDLHAGAYKSREKNSVGCIQNNSRNITSQLYSPKI